MIAWPAETDTARAALRQARVALQVAEDEIGRLLGAHEALVMYRRAGDAVSYAVELLDAFHLAHSQVVVDMEAEEVRHVDAQIMSWMEEDR